jgi:hypothetical protein
MSIGRQLTEFGNTLADKDATKVDSEWQTIVLGDNFVGISLDDSKYLLENIKLIENNVVFVFDFAITAVSLYRDFLFFLPNFMNAVVTYLAGILYNALDSFLRLGVYALVVPPNLADTSFKGLPTTSLKEQADNAYKKFYDVSDPNIPYYLPFEKNLAERVIDDGEKVKNKLKYYFENENSSFNGMVSSEKMAYFERDFMDFKKSAKNLSIPGGFYDAIYLYFSIGYQQSGASVENFIEAVAKIADLFKFPTIEGLLKEYDSLFRPKRKRVRILCVDKILGLDKSVTSNAKDDLKRIDMETMRRNYNDPKLKDWRIFESDPISAMTTDRKNRIKAAFEKQLMYDKLYKEQLDEQGLDSLVEFRLKTNSQFQTLKEEILLIEDEVQYYDYKEYVRASLDGTDQYDYEGFYTKLKTNEKHFTQLNNISEYPQAAAFQTERETYYSAYTAYQNSLDKSAMVKANALDNMMRSQARLFKIGTNVKDETLLTYTSSSMSQADRIQRLNDKLIEEQEIKKEVTKNTQEYLNTELTDRIERIIKSKKDQIKYIEGINTETAIPYDESKLDKSAQLTYLGNFYANSGRTSLYESYMEKFYNFNTIADVDYLYDFIIEVDSSKESFSTKIDSFHAGQYVQIREKTGAGWNYRGAGIIVAEVTEHFTDAGVGTWVKANFSDIIGLTADIKRLQNEILGFQNLFEPNTTAFDAIIDFLKDVKKRILDLIKVLKDLIQIIQLLLSIQLAGKVQAKYVRERDYDQMSVLLTDTTKLPRQTTKRNFKPSRLASVQSYLTKIRSIDRQRAADIADEIDTLFTKTDSADDTFRKDFITNKSVVQESYPVSAAMYQKSQQLRHSIQLELGKKKDNVLSLFDLSTSVYARLTSDTTEKESSVESKEDEERREREIKLATWESKIWKELEKAESNLTNEFGFSLVLLSYLPQGMPFYPIRYLAEKLGLVQQDLGIVGNQLKANVHGSPNPFILDGLDESAIISLMPNKTPNDLVGLLTKNSIARNPAAGYTPQPKSMKVKFNPLFSTSEFNFTLKPILDGTIKSEVGYSHGNSWIKVTESLRMRYLAGAFLTEMDGSPISLGTDKALNTNYKYLYELTLDTGLGSAGCGSSNEIEKVQVYLGGFPFASQSATGDQFLHTHRKGYERNSDGNTLFRFGRMFRKTFSAEIYVKQDITAFLPYILIGYDEDQKLNSFPKFELIDATIKFYRIA